MPRWPTTRKQKVLRKYARYDCLVIDEVGYVEIEPAQVGLFFTLMQKRHKTKTTLITSNLGFGEWGTFLKNNHLTGALLDRLTETCHVINMKHCRSLRTNWTRAEKATRNELRRLSAGVPTSVRALPLESVLLFRGAVRDRHDRRKWHTEQGPLSVSGPKFMNWHRGQGGGGAIDLVMHLAGVDFRTAVAWLQQHLAAGPPTSGEPPRTFRQGIRGS